jgi:phosphoesterase RecJ-like protein
VVIAFLRRKDFADAGAEEPYAEGIIDSIRAVDGTEMAALIREPPTPGGPTHRVSLRSRSDELDVSTIARKAGGGGHKQAAGFSSELPLEELIDWIRAEFSEAAKAAA